MRYGLPRSASPSPDRSFDTSRSTFGFNSDADSEDDREDDTSESASESESVQSSSTDSFCYASESEVPPPPPKPKRVARSLAEQYYIRDTIASIRLRVRHHDPYEEWEKQTKRDAFLTAQKKQAELKKQFRENLEKVHAADLKRRKLLYKKQVEEVQAQLSALNMQREAEAKTWQTKWEERNRQMWARVEAAIKLEEDKLKAKLEAEQRQKEDDERKRKEEEARKQREAEEAAENLRLQQQKQEEDLKKAEEERKKAEEQRKQLEEADRLRLQQSQREQEELQARAMLGATTARDDWARARDALKALKGGAMILTKEDKNMKAMWNERRREITAKIGQLTMDDETVNRISEQIFYIVEGGLGIPKPPIPVRFALLSSLAKTMLRQADAESTVERGAIPIARVAINMMSNLEGFPDVFWAKLCQYTGAWPVPFVVPQEDFDGTPFDTADRRRAQGFREEDMNMGEHITRVSGMMRLYFHILCLPTLKPLDPMFRFPRYWSYFARMLQQLELLRSPVAPELIMVALDVAGWKPREIYGQQWIKMLELLYEAATIGLYGVKMGGDSPEGIAARVRVQLTVEALMAEA